MKGRSFIRIRELASTHGCAWVDGAGKTHYGFRDTPIASRTRLWLGCTSGNAVRQILAAGLGQIVATKTGSYGGECRTVSVNIADFNVLCDAYWERQNTRSRRLQQKANVCHYCGQSAADIGFFGEPVCRGCQ